MTQAPQQSAANPIDTTAFEGTAPVSAAQRIDVPALDAWLAGHVDGYAGPLSIEQFRGGQSNPTDRKSVV